MGNARAAVSDEKDNEDAQAVDGPKALGEVKLAKTIIRMCSIQVASFMINQSEYLITGRNMDVRDLANDLNYPNLVYLIRRFLHEQLFPDSEDSHGRLPAFDEQIQVYASAVATFYAPSDICGTGGMRRERIRSMPSWRGGPCHHDCVFIETDPNAEGMLGLDVGRVRQFFSFKFQGKYYPCALVQWFSRIGDEADEDTGMWIIKPDPTLSVVHLDTILRAAHLIGVYGTQLMPKNLSHSQSLDIFRAYYVNKYIDHQSFEIAF